MFAVSKDVWRTGLAVLGGLSERSDVARQRVLDFARHEVSDIYIYSSRVKLYEKNKHAIHAIVRVGTIPVVSLTVFTRHEQRYI